VAINIILHTKLEIPSFTCSITYDRGSKI